MTKDKQIVSKSRVKAHGEVYTNIREVKSMMDLIPSEDITISATFLEPSCGNGNFLVEILDRKLQRISMLQSDDNIIKDSLIALSSIYGLDIIEDNVQASKLRMLTMWCESLKDIFKNPPAHIIEVASVILNANIQWGNTLTMLYESDKCPLVMTQWDFREVIEGTSEQYGVISSQYYFRDLVERGSLSLLPLPVLNTKHYCDWLMIGLFNTMDFALLEAFYAQYSSI